jgi:hypothetical protein
MTKVMIELEFDSRKNNYEVNDAEVYNYLQELIDNDCLSYTKKTVLQSSSTVFYSATKEVLDDND